MKKIFLILALSFAFLPLFAGEKFLAKYYKVKTTNNPPYTYEFCTIQKGSIVLYIDTKTKNLLQATPRITTSDGKGCWLDGFEAWSSSHEYAKFGFVTEKTPYYEKNYYEEPVYTGSSYMQFQNNDVFLYKVIEYFVNEITYFRNEFDPEYFKKEVLPKIETRYLRYLRNTVFALYDYKFSNKEFMDFFSQFNWYAYDESMTIDKINEKMPQKFVNLVTYIKEEEDRRK